MSDTTATPATKPTKATSKRDRRKGAPANAADAAPGSAFSIASHPRARHSVRQVKAGVGLAGFTLALLLSLRASVPLAVAGERALVAGTAGYLIAWACAVAVWRALLAAEVRARVEAVTARRELARTPAATTKTAAR